MWLFVFLMGLIFLGEGVARTGLALFAAVAVIAVAILPIELDASSRAAALMLNNVNGLELEFRAVRQLLRASSLIYVAAIIQPLTSLPYYLFTAFLPSTIWHPKGHGPSK